jgi:hypothetical protein
MPRSVRHSVTDLLELVLQNPYGQDHRDIVAVRQLDLADSTIVRTRR